MTEGLVTKIVSVVAQYGMLLWLLYFVIQLGTRMWRDLATVESSDAAGTVSPSGASLTVLAAEDESLVGRRFNFDRKITVGRGADNDIVVADAFASHHHAEITMRNNLYIIEDLGSANYTYVNGRVLVGKAYLRPGDEIRIGLLALKFAR